MQRTVLILSLQETYCITNHTQLIPVKINDVVFGLHAVFACVVTILQCGIYPVRIFFLNSAQRLSYIEFCKSNNIVVLLIISACGGQKGLKAMYKTSHCNRNICDDHPYCCWVIR